MDAAPIICFMGINMIQFTLLNNNKMKKEPRHFKAIYSRIILLMIFFPVIANGIFAQCVENIPASCTACVHNVNVDKSCFDSPCYNTPSLTDLKNTGVGPTASVTINATGFATVSNVKVENIIIYDAANPCNPVPGGNFATSSDFNA